MIKLTKAASDFVVPKVRESFFRQFVAQGYDPVAASGLGGPGSSGPLALLSPPASGRGGAPRADQSGRRGLLAAGGGAPGGPSRRGPGPSGGPSRPALGLSTSIGLSSANASLRQTAGGGGQASSSRARAAADSAQMQLRLLRLPREQKHIVIKKNALNLILKCTSCPVPFCPVVSSRLVPFPFCPVLRSYEASFSRLEFCCLV